MASDPTRRTGTSPDGIPAVSVTTLWVQQSVNAKLGGRITEDGVWGRNTQYAVGQYVGTLGANVHGRAGDVWYSVLNVDPEAGRVLLTVPLEQALALSPVSSEEHGEEPPVGPAATSPLFWFIGGAVLLGTALVFYKTAFSKLDGFQENWEEFRQHLSSAKERAARGDCNDAYAHWEQARLLTDSLDDRPRANKTLISAAREVRRNC